MRRRRMRRHLPEGVRLANVRITAVQGKERDVLFLLTPSFLSYLSRVHRHMLTNFAAFLCSPCSLRGLYRAMKTVEEAEILSKVKWLAKACPLVSSYSTSRLYAIAQACRECSLPRGATVFKRGDPADCIFFIFSGSCRENAELEHIAENRWPNGARRVRRETTVALGVLNEGQFFGDESIHAMPARIRTVIASSPVILLTLSALECSSLLCSSSLLVDAVQLHPSLHLGDSDIRQYESRVVTAAQQLAEAKHQSLGGKYMRHREFADREKATATRLH